MFFVRHNRATGSQRCECEMFHEVHQQVQSLFVLVANKGTGIYLTLLVADSLKVFNGIVLCYFIWLYFALNCMWEREGVVFPEAAPSGGFSSSIPEWPKWSQNWWMKHAQINIFQTTKQPQPWPTLSHQIHDFSHVIQPERLLYVITSKKSLNFSPIFWGCLCADVW